MSDDKIINHPSWVDGSNTPIFNPEMDVEIRDFIGVFKKHTQKRFVKKP